MISVYFYFDNLSLKYILRFLLNNINFHILLHKINILNLMINVHDYDISVKRSYFNIYNFLLKLKLIFNSHKNRK